MLHPEGILRALFFQYLPLIWYPSCFNAAVHSFSDLMRLFKVSAGTVNSVIWDISLRTFAQGNSNVKFWQRINMQKKLKSSDLKVRVECEQKTEGLKNEQFSKLQTKDVGLANILSKIKDPLGLGRTAIGFCDQ